MMWTWDIFTPSFGDTLTPEQGVVNIDIFHESKSEFRQNVSAINFGRHNRQIEDVRVEHLASDSIAMSGWTFSQI